MTLPAYGFDDAPFAFGKPVVAADFKSRPEDFIVEEVLGFEPYGEGEHLFLKLQTDDQNTQYTVKLLSRLFAIQPKLISYSGLKDRRGLTSQWFSLHLPGQQVVVNADALSAQGITLLAHSRHNKKLRIGTHKANRFHIRLRNVKYQNAAAGTAEGELVSRLALIAVHGVPNYYGPQRFGHGGGNVPEALDWVERNELPRERQLRSRVLSTLRSWLFNGVLAEKVMAQHWQAWQFPDPVALDGSHSFFQPDSWDATLQARLLEGDIHPAAWLWSADHNGNAPQQLCRYLAQAGFGNEVRPLRLLPSQLVHQPGADETNLSFNLPAGTYATSVLREIVALQDLSLPVQS